MNVLVVLLFRDEWIVIGVLLATRVVRDQCRRLL
jgi:hypothetical protein